MHPISNKYSSQTCQEGWAKQAQRPENADLAIIVISDVRLDDSRTLKGLRKLFERAVDADVIPKIVILCGSFTSSNVSNDVEMDTYRGESGPWLKLVYYKL